MITYNMITSPHRPLMITYVNSKNILVFNKDQVVFMSLFHNTVLDYMAHKSSRIFQVNHTISCFFTLPCEQLSSSAFFLPWYHDTQIDFGAYYVVVV